MKHPQAEGQQDEWINLPLLMSQFADKGYSKYQLQLFEARRRHEAGKLSKKKFHAAERDCLRTLVLLHTSGQPATAQYIQTHVIQSADGQFSLKERRPHRLELYFFYLN